MTMQKTQAPVLRKPASSNAAPEAALRLLVAVVEGLSGWRAVHQLAPWLSANALNVVTDSHKSGKLRSSRIGSVRTQVPRDGAVEAAIRLLVGARSIACAIRMDARRGRWTCTDIQICMPK